MTGNLVKYRDFLKMKSVGSMSTVEGLKDNLLVVNPLLVRSGETVERVSIYPSSDLTKIYEHETLSCRGRQFFNTGKDSHGIPNLNDLTGRRSIYFPGSGSSTGLRVLALTESGSLTLRKRDLFERNPAKYKVTMIKR